MVRILIVLLAVLAIGFGDEDDKILKGSFADIEDFPYIASLQRYGKHYCGASIITANWALTAAHCVDRTADYYKIRAGSITPDKGGTIHQANLAFSHPKFDYFKSTADYDCAIVHVIPAFPIGTPNCKPIKLADVEPAAGTGSVIVGWGGTDANQSGYVSRLQFAEVPIEDRKVCNNQHAAFRIVTPRMICAGYRNGGADTCQRDSGGPLITQGVQTGIVSWGRGCGKPNKTGVYTNVAAMKGWIEDLIADTLL